MQDNWQDFDLMFKSQLENAEVKAPRRVWRSVSSRLDKAAAAEALSRTERSSQRWKWAGAALAFAMALGAGLFFTGTFNKDRSFIEEAPLVAQVSEPGSGMTAPLEVSDAETALSGVRPERHYIKSPAGVPVAPDQRPEVGNAECPQPSDEAGNMEEHQDAGSAVKHPAATDGTRQQDNGAVWAKIMSEDDDIRVVRRKPVLYAQGALSGNDSEITARNVGRMAPSSTSQTDIGITENSTSVYGVPFSIGAGVRFYMSDRLSLGTGLEYSLLTRSFSGTYSSDGMTSFKGDIAHKMHYLGIPVNVYYDVFRVGDSFNSNLKLYVYGGGAAEYCVSNKYGILSSPDSRIVNDPVKGLQWSVGAGLGVEFKIAEHLGVYVDPGVRYYFNNGQPKNIRTDKPLMINFEAGLRVNL